VAPPAAAPAGDFGSNPPDRPPEALPVQAPEVADRGVQSRQVAEELCQAQQQLRQLQQDLREAGRELGTFRQEFQALRAQFEQGQAELAGLRQQAQAAQDGIHQTQARVQEIDQALTTATDDLVKEMLERQHRVVTEADNANRQIHTESAAAVGKVQAQAEETARQLQGEAEAATQRVQGEAEAAIRQLRFEAETATRQVQVSSEEVLSAQAARRDEVEAALAETAAAPPGPAAGTVVVEGVAVDAPTVPAVPEPVVEEDTRVALEETKQLGVTVGPAAEVIEVAPETPAEKAGLQPGDVVVKVDGKPISSGEDLKEAIQQAEPGQEVELTVARKLDTEEGKAAAAEPGPTG
jgi:hypothetical protein